ncbi:hypothetical protein Tco_0357728, partial [Tanacetum coccineum]
MVPSAEETAPFETNKSGATPPPPPPASEIRLRATSPLPLHAPSSPLLPPATGRRKHVPESDVPPQKRLCLTAPIPSIQASEGRTMAAIKVVNLRISYQADVHRRENGEF